MGSFRKYAKVDRRSLGRRSIFRCPIRASRSDHYRGPSASPPRAITIRNEWLLPRPLLTRTRLTSGHMQRDPLPQRADELFFGEVGGMAPDSVTVQRILAQLVDRTGNGPASRSSKK